MAFDLVVEADVDAVTKCRINEVHPDRQRYQFIGQAFCEHIINIIRLAKRINPVKGDNILGGLPDPQAIVKKNRFTEKPQIFLRIGK